MINALGLLEVSGLTASIEAADAMLKAAQVRLLSQTVTSSALITLVIEGDLAACRAALDAGSAAAKRLGHVIARKEIGRPEKDTEWLVTSFQKKNTLVKEIPAKEDTPKKATITEEKKLNKAEITLISTDDETNEITETALLNFIAKHPQGRNVTDVISHFNVARAEAKQVLEDCISHGTLRKRGNRYYVIEVIK